MSAIIKGIVDSGLNVPHSEDIFPSEEKINGKLTSEFSKKLKASDETKYKKQFSKYLKDGLNPEDLQGHFDEIKKKAIGA